MKHMFDVDIAKEYGVNAAILLENIGFWIAKNEANEINFYDGKYWTYNSRKAFHELFPYMSEKQITTALKKLEDSGLIITGNHNSNHLVRTIWYALTEKGKCILHFGKMEYDKMSNASTKKVNCSYYTDNKHTDSKPDIWEASPENVFGSKSERHRHGEYGHVLLTDEHHERLVSDYGKATVETYIQRVDEYCQMHGKAYKDYNLAIRNWMKRDNVTPRSESYDDLGDFDEL